MAVVFSHRESSGGPLCSKPSSSIHSEHSNTFLKKLLLAGVQPVHPSHFIASCQATLLQLWKLKLIHRFTIHLSLSATKTLVPAFTQRQPNKSRRMDLSDCAYERIFSVKYCTGREVFFEIIRAIVNWSDVVKYFCFVYLRLINRWYLRLILF